MPPPEPPKPDIASQERPQAVVLAKTLFHGAKEIVIEHDGVRYRLRITRKSKLILQK